MDNFDWSAYDPLWDSRTPEDKAAIQAGALSDPVRKVQRFGLPCAGREAGPFDWTGCDDVVVMPGRMSGVPTVGPVRFSADTLLAMYESGTTIEELLEDYCLDGPVVRRILAFAQQRKQLSQAA